MRSSYIWLKLPNAFALTFTARAAILASGSIVKDGNDKRFSAVLAYKKRKEENSDEDKGDDEDEGQDSNQSEKQLQEAKYVEAIVDKVRIWRNLLLGVQAIEVFSFVLYYVLLFAVRIPETWSAAVPSGEFVSGLVAGNTFFPPHCPPHARATGYATALHHAIILGFGIHGALCYNPSALRMYGFAQVS